MKTKTHSHELTGPGRGGSWMAIGAALALGACSSPEGTAAQYCKLHVQHDLGPAWELLDSHGRGEITKAAYVDFAWDQKSFDLHILRSGDRCATEVLVPGEEQALIALKLTSLLHDQAFTCALPVAKEDGDWRITRRFAPMEGLRAKLAEARAQLNAHMLKSVELEEPAYRDAARQAVAAYWQAVQAAKAEVAAAAGGSIPPFCHGPLNLDGGKDLAFAYVGFQQREPTDGKPRHLVETEARYRKLVDVLRSEYNPISTSQHGGVRVDLIRSGLQTTKEGTEISNVVVLWGATKPPFSWRLHVFSKGKLTDEGTGSAPELITDAVSYVADAPEVSMVLVDFPKMPAYADQLEVTLFESEGDRELKTSIPVQPEFLDKG